MLQTSATRRPFLLACAALAASIAAGVATTAQSSTDTWWTGYGSGADHSRYVPSKQITRGNVSRLQVAWTYPFGDTGSGPIVARGVVYGRGRNGSLIALDAATGAERWVRERMIGMTSRGMNYWASADGRDQRLIFAMDGLLQEVDANTGKSVMSFGTNGAVDLRVGLDGRDPESIGNIQSSIPGEIFGNLVIVGSATGEGYMSPPGDIRAYDVVTGRLVWTFHTVPRPGEFGYDTWPKEAWKYVGGVNNWAEMTVDARRGIVYIPLGSPTYDFYGADRVGSNLFGTSLVALDARTGRRRWHFQFVHHDLWDLDPSAAPQLTTIRHNGRTRDVVVASAKTPWLYVFDRETGEPIWPIEERPVPKSDMPGEQSWPTQPYPTNPPPHARQSFGVADISPYLPADEAARFATRLRAAKNLGLFTPINYADTVHVPTSNGGVLFGGMASEPETGAVYVVSHDNPGILRLLRPGEKVGRGGPPQPPGQAVYQQNCQSCHGPDRLGVDGMPALVFATADPANNIAAGAPRFDAAAIRAVIAAGKGRMPAMPHLAAADVDALVALLTYARRAGARRPGPSGLGRAAGTDRRLGLRVDAARRACGTRTRGAAAVPGRRSAIRAPGDQRVQHGRQPDCASVHVDREVRPECASHQVARRLRRRPGAGRARGHRHGNARHAQWRDRHRVRSALRRGPRQCDSCVGHRHRCSAVVVPFRRRLHRFARDVRNRRASVPAGARGEHAAPTCRLRYRGTARLGRVRLAAQAMK